MQDGKNGAVKALRFVVDAVQKHKIVSPSCVETGELAALKSFSSGQHAFALMPKSAAHAQRPEAEPGRRQDEDRPDAERRERHACDRR